jgi:hypothetical protein
MGLGGADGPTRIDVLVLGGRGIDCERGGPESGALLGGGCGRAAVIADDERACEWSWLGGCGGGAGAWATCCGGSACGVNAVGVLNLPP